MLTRRSAEIPDILIVEPPVFGDTRGYLMESWHRDRYADAGVPADFVQDNMSWSKKGTLRGLHCQEPFGQGKLVQVLDGEVFDVAVDVRLGSPTFGRWVGMTLSGANHRQLYIPPGFAHGFAVVSESAVLLYKCTEYYAPDVELVVAWDDPALAIDWPVDEPILSARDRLAPRLADIPSGRLPTWKEGGRPLQAT